MSVIDGGYLSFDLQKHKYSSSIDYDDSVCETTTNERAILSAAASNGDNVYEEPLGNSYEVPHGKETKRHMKYV